MKNLQIGDKVRITDGSYVFGIRKGKYTTNCDCFNGDREGLTVLAVNIDVMAQAQEGERTGRFSRVCNTIVTDRHGSFWFTPDKHCRLIDQSKMISINGKKWSEDTIAEALKKHAV